MVKNKMGKSQFIKEEHPYAENLEKFLGKIVEVKTILGETIRGKCIGIKQSHLNIIVENDDEVFIVKNINYIRRNKNEKKR